MHRSGLGEGMDALSPGMSVSFMPQWDEKKRKDRASDVCLGGGWNTGGWKTGGKPGPPRSYIVDDGSKKRTQMSYVYVQ